MKSIVRNKLFIIGCGVVVILGLLIWGTIDNLRRNATVTFEFTPTVASLYLDDKKVSETTKVAPGTYTASVRQEGFANYDETFTVEKDSTYTVYAVLESNSDATANWYADHPSDDRLRQQILNRKLAADSAAIEKAFPIAAILPYLGPSGGYRIDYGISKSKEKVQAVYVQFYTEKGKQLANEFITSQGYKLADYEIIYEQKEFGAPYIPSSGEAYDTSDEHFEGDGHDH